MAGPVVLSMNIFAAIIISSVLVTVTHGNSNPTFTVDLQFEPIVEAENNTLFGTIGAYDPDGDTLVYGIQETGGQYLSNSGSAHLFLRVETNGEVWIKSPVDREVFEQLSATWTVSDGTVIVAKIPPVKIFVEDINDNRPFFDELPNRLDDLSEDTLPGMVVLSITIVDVDDGDNGTADAIITEVENVFCEMEKFRLEPVTDEDNRFNLVLNETLSYDDQYEYTVCLKTEDRGTPPLNSSISRVIIPIGDIQGSPPVFLNQPYDESIPEDSSVGDYVLTVTAQDGDTGVASPNTVTYQMESDEFEIDKDSGIITVKGQLDRKATPSYTLTVNATEVDSGQPMDQILSQTQVFITISDTDDEIPIFTPNKTSATITENSPVNSPLNMDLNVDDGDTPEFARFTLSLNQSLDAFRLEGTEYTSTARVDVRVKDRSFLDYEARTQLTFQVIATTPTNASSVAEVTVYITDENDNTPLFTEPEYQGNFTEDATEGEFILAVQATDDDGDNVTYSTSTSEFDIDPVSGVITVGGGTFDAELRTQYTFTVTASDGGGRSGAVLVTLQCTDVNDDPPVFLRDEVTITEEEFEGAAPAEPIGSVQASDFDVSQPNNLIQYDIIAGNEVGKFAIDGMTGDIYFVDDVDFEDYQSFQLTVMAEDQGVPPLNDTASVIVKILDVNDNAPRFDVEVYSFIIFENATDGALVGKLHATDLDSSYNGQVDYVISSGSQDDFFINSNGEIIVSEDLDRDETATYDLTIVARDRGTPQKTDDCTVYINLRDINDKPPMFSQGEYEATIPEDEPIDSVIVTLTATDSDEDSDLVFYIGSVYPPQPYQFSLSEGGHLSVNQSLDYENATLFTLTVVVQDRNQQEGEAEDTASVSITITDVNDNAPYFENLPYNFTVLEESGGGTVISTDVSALDDDSGNNAAVSYSLVDDSDGRVQINPYTGTLSVNGRIDRETIELLSVTINATDGGRPGLWTAVTAYITVSDTNDNEPVFNNASCTYVEIFENSNASTPVCQVHADDKDSEFGHITYSIGGGNVNGWFQIDNVTGQILVAETPPDREQSDEVILNINAEDPGQRQDTLDVTVRILDENDNAPVFTLFIPNVDTTESTPAGVELARVIAEDSDLDGTDASAVRYEIVSGNSQGLWEIDPVSGFVYTAQSLASSAGVFVIRIVAHDLGTPQMRSEPKAMTIDVQDVNDVAPKFNYPRVYEDSSNITKEYIDEDYNTTEVPLFRANATDNDEGIKGAFIYKFVEIIGGDEDWRNFRVDNITGDVYYICAPPDPFAQSVYKLTLEALNYLSEAQLSSLVNFEVHVNDTIDDPPYFWDPADSEPPTQTLEKTENTGGAVGRVEAPTEEDSGQPFYYYIVGGNEEGLFYINSTSGMIYATKDLGNIDSESSYELIIKVTNDGSFEAAGGRRRREAVSTTYDPATDPSLLTVIIVVVDGNDNPPVFTANLYTAGVLYTVDFDVSVVQVEVVDLDELEVNRQVVYAIDEERRINPENNQSVIDDAFAIDENGIITTQTSFLGLTGGVYFEMVVSATDPSKTEFRALTEVFISVITEKQQLRVHLNDSSGNVAEKAEGLESLFGEILETYEDVAVNVSVDFDKIATYTEDDGTPYPSDSEILFHVIELEKFTVLPAESVMYALDHSPSYIDEVKDTYAVHTIFLASIPPPDPVDWTFVQWIVVAIATLFLGGVIGVGLVIYGENQRHNLRLRAYGIKTQRDIPADIGPVPGTHALFGGNNPVFMNQTYDTAFEENEVGGDGRDRAMSTSDGYVDPDSDASIDEAVMEMEDDGEDYEDPDNEEGGAGGNTEALDEVLYLHDEKEARYATAINLPGFDDVTDV